MAASSATRSFHCPGEPGVDDGDALGRVDQVHGDDVVADAVEGGAELAS